MSSTPLSRNEAKYLTRRRLLKAALAILDKEGEAGLTTIKVAKSAGIAQSSFYVHFKDKNDLLRALRDEGGESLRTSMRDARRRAREAPKDVEQHRDTFRIPMEAICRHPELLRIQLRARHDPSSSLREFAVETADLYRQHHAADLAALGYTANDERDRRRLEMIAEGLNAATDALALGVVEGRYPELEEAVDILTAMSRGTLRFLKSAQARVALDKSAPDKSAPDAAPDAAQDKSAQDRAARQRG